MLKGTILAALCGMVLLHGFVFFQLRKQIAGGYPDFTIFYTAGKCLREGLGRRLYDPATQWRLQQSFAANVQNRQSPLPYNHPPFEALLFAPLAAMPYSRAYTVWALINILLLVLFWRLIRRRLPLLNQFSAALPLAAVFAFFPVFVAVLQGQDSILLLALCTLALLALEAERDFSAGVCLALGLFRPQLVLPMAAVLLLRRRWQAVAGLGAGGCALALISAGVVGWQELFAYPGYLLHLNANLAGSGIQPRDMPNLRGMLFRLLGGDTAWVSGLVAAGSLALVGLAAWKWSAEARQPDFDMGFGLTVTVAALVSYHMLAHDLSLLLIPLLLAAEWLLRERTGGAARRLVVAAIAVMFLSPLYFLLWFRYQRFTLLFWMVALLAAGLSLAQGREKGGSLARRAGHSGA